MGVFARSVSAGPYGSQSTLVVQEELILTPAQSLLLDICNWCLSPSSSSSSSHSLNPNRSFSVLPSCLPSSSPISSSPSSNENLQKQEEGAECDEVEKKLTLSLLVSSFPSFSEITKEEVQKKALSHYILSRKMKNFLISETVGLMEREPSLALSHLFCWLVNTKEDVRFLREGKVLQKWVKKVAHALQTQRSLFFIDFNFFSFSFLLIFTITQLPSSKVTIGQTGTQVISCDFSSLIFFVFLFLTFSLSE